MQVSVEISLYPLSDEFIPEVVDYCERIKMHSSLKVETNGMSTQIFGDYDKVMDVIKNEIKTTFERKHKSAFIVKILNIELGG